MDENQENQQETSETVEKPNTPEVGFPIPPQKTSTKSNKWVFIVLGLIILIGGAIFLFSRGASQDGEDISPTPTTQGFETISSPTATPSPKEISRDGVSIEIQNGTGIAGEAAYLQGKLKELGYADIEAGNADSQDNETTVVTFSKTVSSDVVSEITKELETIYKEVETKSSSTQSVDVLIVTGLKKGVTPKPTETATPTTTATPTSTSGATPTQ